MHPTADLRRLTSLERLLGEFWEIMKAAMEPPLFEGADPLELEERLIKADTGLAAAEGCVNAMARVWPEGQDIYDRFLLAISELSNRRQFAEAFALLMSLDIPQSELMPRYKLIMSKNRETLMIAGTYIEEAADILFQQTGIRLSLD